MTLDRQNRTRNSLLVDPKGGCGDFPVIFFEYDSHRSATDLAIIVDLAWDFRWSRQGNFKYFEASRTGYRIGFHGIELVEQDTLNLGRQDRKTEVVRESGKTLVNPLRPLTFAALRPLQVLLRRSGIKKEKQRRKAKKPTNQLNLTKNGSYHHPEKS